MHIFHQPIVIDYGLEVLQDLRGTRAAFRDSNQSVILLSMARLALTRMSNVPMEPMSIGS